MSEMGLQTLDAFFVILLAFVATGLLWRIHEGTELSTQGGQDIISNTKNIIITQMGYSQMPSKDS